MSDFVTKLCSAIAQDYIEKMALSPEYISRAVAGAGVDRVLFGMKKQKVPLDALGDISKFRAKAYQEGMQNAAKQGKGFSAHMRNEFKNTREMAKKHPELRQFINLRKLRAQGYKPKIRNKDQAVKDTARWADAASTPSKSSRSTKNTGGLTDTQRNLMYGGTGVGILGGGAVVYDDLNNRSSTTRKSTLSDRKSALSDRKSMLSDRKSALD